MDVYALMIVADLLLRELHGTESCMDGKSLQVEQITFYSQQCQ